MSKELPISPVQFQNSANQYLRSSQTLAKLQKSNNQQQSQNSFTTPSKQKIQRVNSKKEVRSLDGTPVVVEVENYMGFGATPQGLKFPSIAVSLDS